MKQPSQGILARTATGAGWVMAWRLTTRLIGVFSTLVLVRLLAPADFGLVALATSLTQSVAAFSTLGVEEAVIRARDPGPDTLNTGFTLNVIRGALSAIVVLLAAVPTTHFFNQPGMLPVLLALAAGVVIESWENIGVVEFRRTLAFHREFRLLLPSRLIGVTVTLTLALLLRGRGEAYWALVGGILAKQIASTVTTYVMHPFRPRLSLRAWRDIVSFSAWTWVMTITGMMGSNVSSFSIGRILGTAPVGIYSVAVELAMLPSAELAGAMGRAAFPGFVAARDSGLGIGQIWLRMITVAAALVVPAGVGVSLLAGPVILLAFGPAWSAAAPLVALFGVAGAITLPNIIGEALFAAHSELPTMFVMQLTALVVRLVLVLPLTLRFGLDGTAVGASAALAIENALYLGLTMRRFHVGIGALFHAMWRILAATALMALVLWAAGLGWAGIPSAGAAVWRIVAGTAIGVLCYGLALLGLWVANGRPAGPEADLLDLLRRLAGSLPSVSGRRVPAPPPG